MLKLEMWHVPMCSGWDVYCNRNVPGSMGMWPVHTVGLAFCSYSTLVHNSLQRSASPWLCARSPVGSREGTSPWDRPWKPLLLPVVRPEILYMGFSPSGWGRWFPSDPSLISYLAMDKSLHLFKFQLLGVQNDVISISCIFCCISSGSTYMFLSHPWGGSLVFSMCVSVTQLCLTLCHSMDCSLPDSSVHGILQAQRRVAIPFSRGSSQPRDWTWVSHIAGRFLTIWATREAQGFNI